MNLRAPVKKDQSINDLYKDLMLMCEDYINAKYFYENPKELNLTKTFRNILFAIHTSFKNSLYEAREKDWLGESSLVCLYAIFLQALTFQTYELTLSFTEDKYQLHKKLHKLMNNYPDFLSDKKFNELCQTLPSIFSTKNPVRKLQDEFKSLLNSKNYEHRLHSYVVDVKDFRISKVLYLYKPTYNAQPNLLACLMTACQQYKNLKSGFFKGHSEIADKVINILQDVKDHPANTKLNDTILKGIIIALDKVLTDKNSTEFKKLIDGTYQYNVNILSKEEIAFLKKSYTEEITSLQDRFLNRTGSLDLSYLDAYEQFQEKFNNINNTSLKHYIAHTLGITNQPSS